MIISTQEPCRVCNGTLLSLMTYENMPKAAQNLPDKQTIDSGQDAGVDLEVCQCEDCGLIQLNNEPVEYYKEVIRASAFSEEMKQFRIKQFKNFVTRYNLSDKNVIEVGTGKGEYLALMKQFVTNAYGLEYGEESVSRCRENDLNVVKGYIDRYDYNIPYGPYDAFFILNFFEHIPEPNVMLKGLCNNLTDDAIGLVEVPNFDMILRQNLYSEFIGDHIFYFTKETLRSTLSKNGFEVIDCKEIWYDYILSAVVKKRKATDLSPFKSHKKNIENVIDNYISSYNKVAIWGAGHQALTVLSLANLGNKIQYVIDDADFKQNKYTPATHIPIVSSQTLREKPVDAIIVMAASYSDEGAKKIRQNFDKDIDVSILRDYGLETA